MRNESAKSQKLIRLDAETGRSNRWSLILSIVFHASLLVLLAVFFRQSQAQGGSAGDELRRVDVVLAELTPEEETEYLEESDIVEETAEKRRALFNKLL